MNTKIGSLPYHRYVWVDSRFTHEEPVGWVRAEWFGLVSHPGRVWGCNVMFSFGGVYREIPPHAVAFCPDPEKKWAVNQAQLWDCYGVKWWAHEYTALRSLRCRARIRGKDYGGMYLFTVAPCEDGFSEAPEQSKEFKFIALDNGRLTIQPTNRVIFEDRSFTDPEEKIPKLKLQTEWWSCEE
jgi:hypothetical protein